VDFEENRGTEQEKIDTNKPKPNPWARFWNWYEDKILGSVILIAIIQFIQIPHMVWNADMMLEAGMISRVHPVIDWFLYGVDLIEIVSIVNVGMIMYSLVKKRKKGHKTRS
jgi:hypothetical protein